MYGSGAVVVKAVLLLFRAKICGEMNFSHVLGEKKLEGTGRKMSMVDNGIEDD